MMVAYQEDVVFTADGVVTFLSQVLQAVHADFAQHVSLIERFLSPLIQIIHINFGANEKKRLPLFPDLLGQHDVVLGKSGAWKNKECMILVELYFLAVRFQVRKCFCSNPWQIPNLYVWILWMIEGCGLWSSLNNANFGSTNIIISKPRKGTGVLICYGSFYRCFFVKLSRRLFSENLGFRNQLKFDEKKLSIVNSSTV